MVSAVHQLPCCPQHQLPLPSAPSLVPPSLSVTRWLSQAPAAPPTQVRWLSEGCWIDVPCCVLTLRDTGQPCFQPAANTCLTCCLPCVCSFCLSRCPCQHTPSLLLLLTPTNRCHHERGCCRSDERHINRHWRNGPPRNLTNRRPHLLKSWSFVVE